MVKIEENYGLNFKFFFRPKVENADVSLDNMLRKSAEYGFRGNDKIE